MKCRVCGEPANIRLPQYNSALCAADFIAFFEKRVSGTIGKYGLLSGQDKTLVAVSGGKDSLSLWHLLQRLGFSADGIYIDLGIQEYSRVSLAKASQMADRLQRRLYSFSLSETFSKGIGELARIMKRAPCSLCGTIKRYVMNRACTQYGYSVLATGHNLDDEASALLGNLLHWKEEYLWKKGVLLEGERGLAQKGEAFLPLLRKGSGRLCAPQRDRLCVRGVPVLEGGQDPALQESSQSGRRSIARNEDRFPERIPEEGQRGDSTGRERRKRRPRARRAATLPMAKSATSAA